MIRKFYFFFVLIFLSKITAQTTNTHILNSADNALIKDEVYYCPGETFNLKVNAQATSTGDYTITKSTDISIFNAGTTPIKFAPSVANKFSEPIDIGFPFSFYGQTYTKVVAGTNGRLVFTNSSELNNLNDVNTYIDRTYSGTINPVSKLPSKDYNKIYKNDAAKELALVQIFFAYTDLYATTGSSTLYNYKSVNIGGLKGLLISYQNAVRTNGVGGISGNAFNSYVILFEDGRILVYVQNKTEENYNAILGIQNETATKFRVPSHSTFDSDYNNGKWKSESVAWIFTPSQNLTPKIEWLVDGVQKSTTPNYIYQPVNDSEKLEVKISYFDDTNVQIGNTETSFSIFKKVKTPVILKTLGDCHVSLKVTDETYDSKLNYTWYKVGSPYSIATGREYTIMRYSHYPGMYYVVVTKSDGSEVCTGRSKSNVLSYDKEQFPSLITPNPVVCDNSSNPEAVKTINLYDYYYPKYNPSTSNLLPYNVKYYDATGVLIADPQNFKLTANKSYAISWSILDENNNTYCLNGGHSITYLAFPDKMTINLCTNVISTYNLKDIFEKTTESVIRYEYTYDDGTSAGDGTSIDARKNVIVKVFNVFGGCSIKTIVSFLQSTTISVPDVPVQERCAGSKTNIPNWFDLAAVRQILDPNNLYDVKFYRKSNNTELSQNGGDGSELSRTNFWSGRMGDYIIYARLYDKTNPTCYGESKDIILRVYTKPSIAVQTPIILTNCTGNSVFNLTQNTSSLTNAPSTINPTFEYYSQNNQLLTSAEISAYDATIHGLQPYIKITYNVSCGDIIKFDLKYNPEPASKITQITVCEEKTYAADQFKNLVIDNPTQYSFYENDGTTPLRSNFNWSVLPLKVDFFIKNNSTGCISDLQSVTFQKGANTSILKTETDYILCDSTTDIFDGKTVFNLDSKKGDFSTNTTATFKYYKDAAYSYSQEITNPTNYTNETAFNQTIFVKISAAGFCTSEAKINLIVNTPTKSKSLQDKYFICLGDNLRIDAGTENIKWDWNDGQSERFGVFTKAGNYSVKLTNSNGCSYTHNFVISDENQAKIQQINQTEQQIEVIATGKYTIEYSFDDGKTWQTSNIYQNPTAEQYDIQVRSVLAPNVYCLGEKKSIFTINIINVITPNGDGKNDVWTIKNLNKMQNIEIIISDRFGKTVYNNQWNNNSDLIMSPGNNTINSEISWDGKYNGRALPTSTYWYIVKWFDPSTNKNESRQGWILLKNRN